MPDADPPAASGGDGASGAAVFDARVLSDMFGEDTAIVAAVLETFVESMTTSLAELHAALGQDAAAVSSLAHKIKGAARMSGALALAEAAVELEGAARSAPEEAMRAAASQLELQWTLLREHPAMRGDIGGGQLDPA